MKKYMLIIVMGSESFTTFSDDYNDISRSKMDAECGLGGYCELYERTHDDELKRDAYQLMEI